MKKPTSLRYSGSQELTKGSPDSAGIDLKLIEEVVIDPQQTKVVKTDLFLEIPKGYFGLLVPRSSFGLNHPELLIRTGIIDSDFRGELSIVIFNSTKRKLFKNNSVVLNSNQRIAQIILIPHISPVLSKVDILSKTKRGSGDFGSTGL